MANYTHILHARSIGLNGLPEFRFRNSYKHSAEHILVGPVTLPQFVADTRLAAITNSRAVSFLILGLRGLDLGTVNL